MNRYFSLIIVLLFICVGLFYQWTRSDQQRTRFDRERERLETDLRRISKIRADLSTIEKEISGHNEAIQVLELRVPPTPQEDIFIEQLSAQLNNHDISLILESSETKKKDFYRETIFRFALAGGVPDESVVADIFRKMKRIVGWQIIGPDNVQETKIYSTTYDMKTPGIIPCATDEQVAMNYWPFNAHVGQGLHRLDEKCAERNRGVDLLVEVKELQGHLKHRTILEEIVKQLAGDTVKYQEAPITSNN